MNQNGAITICFLSIILSILASLRSDYALTGVEKGIIPPSIAMEIARAKDSDVQNALAEVYEQKTLPGNQILPSGALSNSVTLRAKQCIQPDICTIEGQKSNVYSPCVGLPQEDRAAKQTDLAKPEQPKKMGGMTREQMARMEREIASLQQDIKQVESSYGDDVFPLVIASGYLAKLVANKEVEHYPAASSWGIS